MLQILVVEDDHNISDIIVLTMTAAGYTCHCAYDGRQAADCIEQSDYDLILLDIMLPEFDGFELMDYIAPLGIPVIFLTAKAAVKDRVKGLRMGADDYIVKPFDPDELLARSEAVLRRAGKGVSEITVHDAILNLESRTVLQAGQAVSLTPNEFDLLCALVRNKGIALYRDALFEQVWGRECDDGSRTLDLHIMRLRKKLCWQDKIVTVYKIGYLLEKET